MTDSAYMGSESTYSECETFTDEDTSTLVHPELQAEGDADSAGGSAVPSECLDALEDPGHGALLLLPGRSVPWLLLLGHRGDMSCGCSGFVEGLVSECCGVLVGPGEKADPPAWPEVPLRARAHCPACLPATTNHLGRRHSCRQQTTLVVCTAQCRERLDPGFLAEVLRNQGRAPCSGLISQQDLRTC